MKKTVVTICLMGLIISGCNAKSVQLKTEADKEQYAVGVNIARNFIQSNIEVDPDLVMAGFQDANANTLKLTNQEVEEGLISFFKKQERKAQLKQEEASKGNREKGESFLTQNAKKPGVKTTASGLQYRVLEKSKQSSARKPRVTDTVTVHYRGTLIDGTEFDSSFKRNKPASFPLNGVIRGWTEGLQLMSVGDRFEFVIPSELAYGKRGAGGQIGPDSVLVFEVSLLNIK